MTLTTDLDRIALLASYITRDAREPDKVLAYAQEIEILVTFCKLDLDRANRALEHIITGE